MARKPQIKRLENSEDTKSLSILPSELQITPENREAIIETCNKVGLTREKCIIAINEGLLATKIALDKYGTEHEEPDHVTRLKSATMGLELLGDYRNKDTIKPTTYNTVIYQWRK